MVDEKEQFSKFTVTSSAEELRYAARCGDVEQTKEILARYESDNSSLRKLLPAVVAATDNLSGNSPLHLCCANGHYGIVELLLDKKAPMDQENLSGSTPLHYASLTGELEVVKLLIKRGAKAVVENKYGKTAVDEAHSGKHAHVAKLLIEHVEASVAPTDVGGTSENNTGDSASNSAGNSTPNSVH